MTKRAKLNMSAEEHKQLENLTSSRSESMGKVGRAKLLLAYAEGMKISVICRKFGLTRRIVEYTIDKALNLGISGAISDLPRSGRSRRITDDARSWVLDLACRRPVDLGYTAKTWTYSALVKHIRANCGQAGYGCLCKIGKSVLNGIMSKGNIRPHKVSYYLEHRDPDFESKVANVLCVYKEVGVLNDIPDINRASTTISYDEKPEIQAIKNIAPQLQPVPGKYSHTGRDHEYKRLGTLSLLAGIDLHTGKVFPFIKERHRSREFIEFLSLLDCEYPAEWKIRLVLDNHSAHISKETQAYLKTRTNRFEFIFTPKHGSWLNMIEMFFSKVARGFLRNIRVETKKELETRIYQGIQEINEEPVVFRWKYKMEEAGII